MKRFLIWVDKIAYRRTIHRSKSNHICNTDTQCCGAGSTLDETEEILNDILFVRSKIDEVNKNKCLTINYFFLVKKVGCCLKKI